MPRIYKYTGKNAMVAAHNVAEAIKEDYLKTVLPKYEIKEDVWTELFMYIWNIVRYGEYLTPCKIIVGRIGDVYKICNIKSKVRKSMAEDFIEIIDIANQHINNSKKILELYKVSKLKRSDGMITLCYSVIVGKFEMYSIAYNIENKIFYHSAPLDDEFVELSMVVDLPVKNIEHLQVLITL